MVSKKIGVGASEEWVEPIARMNPILVAPTMVSLFGTTVVSFEEGVEFGNQSIEGGASAKVEVRAVDQPMEAGAYLEMEARASDQLVEEVPSLLQGSVKVPL